MPNDPGDSPLAQIVAPVPVSTFIEDYVGQRYLHAQGTRGRFGHLLPWDTLNSLLQHHGLNHGRVHLWKDGAQISSSTFVRERPGRSAADVRTRLLAPEINRHLREGATLVIDQVDELHPPLGSLTETLEHIFQAPIQANLYAGWRSSPGFEAHTDDHDVLILQIHGKKHWSILGRAARIRFRGDPPESAAQAPTTPEWTGWLNDGDALYMPRGWWHIARPCEEPTVHLTIGFTSPTGADYLGWLFDQLKMTDLVRSDIPRFGKPSNVAAYADKLHKALHDACEPRMIGEFLCLMNAKAEPRCYFNLPWDGFDAILPPDDDFMLRFVPSRPPVIRKSGGATVELLFNSRAFMFSADCEDVIHYLHTHSPLRKSTLMEVFSDRFDSESLYSFCVELARNGIIVCESETPFS